MAGKKNFANIGGDIVEELLGGAQPEAAQQPKAEPKPEPKARPMETAHPTRLASNDAERARMVRQAEANAALVARRGNWRREKPNYGETRSHRTQLLVKPSIFEALQAIADRENVSFNQIAERAFAEYIDNHADGQE